MRGRRGTFSGRNVCLTVFVFLSRAGVAGERDRGGDGIRGDHIGKGKSQLLHPKSRGSGWWCFLCLCFLGVQTLNYVPVCSSCAFPILSPPRFP